MPQGSERVGCRVLWILGEGSVEQIEGAGDIPDLELRGRLIA